MKIGNIFYRRIQDGFYPSFSNFLNAIRDELGDGFVKSNRNEIKNYYFAQEIVQVFQPPPLMEALKRKEGFYPKIISFFPFERLYCDVGFIRIFTGPRKKQKEIVDVEKTDDYEENIKKNGEYKFPKELRWVYSSGIKKSGNKGGNKMPDDLIKERDQYIIAHPETFSTVLVKNAQKRIDAKTT